MAETRPPDPNQYHPGFAYDRATDTWIDRDGERYQWSHSASKLVAISAPCETVELKPGETLAGEGTVVGHVADNATRDIDAAFDRVATHRPAAPTVEELIQAKNLNAPRVTPQRIEEVIASEHYFTAYQGCLGAESAFIPSTQEQALQLLTFCVLVLTNGFTVTGESACASPENFNAEIGQKIARQNAVAKIWPLEGYLLRQQLHNDQVLGLAKRG